MLLRVGKAVLPSHPPSAMSTVVSVSVIKSWSGCVAFSSTIHDEYSSKCECYGWKTLPNFGPTENSIDKAAHLSGWCVTGWFEGEMTY